MMTKRKEYYSMKLSLRPMRVMVKHPKRKGGYLFPRDTDVPPVDLQIMALTFVKETKAQISQMSVERKCRLKAMGFITLLEHRSVFILQDTIEMIINDHTYYLFLNPVFFCKLFKDYVKVMRVSIDTVHETEKTIDVISDELDNKITDFHNTLDSSL
jgi:hypothetical protein